MYMQSKNRKTRRFDHSNERQFCPFFPSILSASLNFKAHWLVTHLHVSHISAVFISPPSAAIIQHRILLCVEDSNRKLRAYFYGMVPVQDIVVYTYQLSYYLYNKDITNSV